MRPDAERGAQVRSLVGRSTATNVLAKGFALAVGFLLTPFILDRVGPTSYALWVLIGSIVAYGALLDFGITGGLVKHVAGYWAQGDRARAEEVIGSALAIFTAFGVAILLASLALAPILPGLFRLPPDQQIRAGRLLVLMGFAVALSLPCAAPLATLRALQRFDLANVVSVVATVLSATGTVIALLLGGDIEELVIVSVAVNLIVQIPAIWLLHRVAPGLHVRIHRATRRTARSLMSFSWYIFVTQTATRVHYRTDELIIGAFLPVISITPYALARRLAEVAQALADQFMRVLLPLASELHAAQDALRLRKLLLDGTRLSLAIHTPVALATVLMAGPLLGAWVGEEYVRYAPLVWLLAAAIFIDTGLWPAGAVLQAMARHQRLAAFAVFGAVLNLALSIALVRNWGLAGVAGATVVSTLIVSYGLTAPYALSVIGAPFLDVVRSVVLPVLVPVLPSVLGILGVRPHVSTSLLGVLGAVGLGCAIYWLVFFFTGTTRAEREWIRLSVRPLRERVRRRSDGSAR